MTADPNLLAVQKNDLELQYIIDNRQKYLPDTTEASLAELQRRGTLLNDEEIDATRAYIAIQRNQALLNRTNYWGRLNNSYIFNIVQDPAAPQLFSRSMIIICTAIFGALFGSVMFAMNAAKLRDNKGVVTVLLFGLSFTVLQFIVAYNIHMNSFSWYDMLCGLIAAFCIDLFFWPRYIGNSTFYRARSGWVPLFIGVLFIIMIILATMMDLTIH